MWSSRGLAGLLSVAIVTVLSGAAGGYESGSVAGGGTIKGTVRFAAEVPPSENLTVTKDFEVCGNEKPSEEFVVSQANKGLKNVVVSLAAVSKGKSFAGTEAVLTQKGCQYLPHVLLVPRGATVKVLNHDGILHNIHTFSAANPSINMAQPKFKPEVAMRFEKPEVVKVGCDVHDWMRAYVVVEDHPYYTLTDEQGAFELSDVPPGNYELRAWHEGLGEMKKSVAVAAGKTSEASFEIRPRE